MILRGSQLFKAPGEKQPLWPLDGQELVLFDDTGKTNVAQKQWAREWYYKKQAMEKITAFIPMGMGSHWKILVEE